MGKSSIVIAWQKNPFAREPGQSLNGLEDRPVLHFVAVEGITSHQDSIDLTLMSKPRDPFDCLDALRAQFRAWIACNVRKGFANLPIGRVDESKCQVCPRSHHEF
jgi:hypothetical protein